MNNHQSAQPKDIADLAQELKARGDAFAIATVVRTVSVTAAKPGAKAIIDQQGQLLEGWIGGGCARHAVVKAALQCIDDGTARLVSLQPEELTTDQQHHDLQVVNATNMCPSRGSMDIFVEPVLANPVLLVIGSSPVAAALVEIGALFDLQVIAHQPDEPVNKTHSTTEDTSSFHPLSHDHPHRYIVISTQGSGDLKALSFALSLKSQHIGFVGSRRKFMHLKDKLANAAETTMPVSDVKCPAGVDIHAVTPQEIALSILAEIVRLRRS